MKNSREIAESVKKKAVVFEKQRKRKIAAAMSAVSVCLVIAISLGIALPLVLGVKGEQHEKTYLEQFATSITKDVSNAVSGLDQSSFNRESGIWGNQAKYDVDLSKYPASITNYLAYRLETNPADTYYWVKLEEYDAYCNYINQPGELETFLKEMNAPQDRTVITKYREDVDGNLTIPYQLVGLWTKKEIMTIALKYEKMFPTHKREGISITESYYYEEHDVTWTVTHDNWPVWIGISSTVDITDPYSEILDFDLYYPYTNAADDDLFNVSISYKRQFEDPWIFIDGIFSRGWNEIMAYYLNIVSMMPKSDLLTEMPSYFSVNYHTSAMVNETRLITPSGNPATITAETWREERICEFNTKITENVLLINYNANCYGSRNTDPDTGLVDMTPNYQPYSVEATSVFIADIISMREGTVAENPRQAANWAKKWVNNWYWHSNEISKTNAIEYTSKNYDITIAVNTVLTKAQIKQLMDNEALSTYIKINPAYDDESVGEDIISQCVEVKRLEREDWWDRSYYYYD